MGASGEVIVVILAATAGLLAGGMTGLWVGARGHELASGRPVLIAIVGVFAVAGLVMYTVGGGGSSDLFTRFATLPLTLLIAIGSAAILVGAPMYAGYMLGYKVGRRRDR